MSMLSLNQFIERSIEVPYVPFGRDMSGWDCWGLVYCAYKDVRGIELPLLDKEYSSALDKAEVEAIIKEEEFHGQNWKETVWPELMDLVVLTSTERMCHVGILVEKGWVLHALPGRNTSCERIQSAYWNRRLRGYARYVGNG